MLRNKIAGQTPSKRNQASKHAHHPLPAARGLPRCNVVASRTCNALTSGLRWPHVFCCRRDRRRGAALVRSFAARSSTCLLASVRLPYVCVRVYLPQYGARKTASRRRGASCTENRTDLGKTNLPPATCYIWRTDGLVPAFGSFRGVGGNEVGGGVACDLV